MGACVNKEKRFNNKNNHHQKRKSLKDPKVFQKDLRTSKAKHLTDEKQNNGNDLPNGNVKTLSKNYQQEFKNEEEQYDFYDQLVASAKVYKPQKRQSGGLETQHQFEEELIKLESELERRMDKQKLSGTIKQQKACSCITLYNSDVALEFTLPKTAAGPLLVPYINYQAYEKEINR